MGWSRLDLGVGIVALAGLDHFWDDINDLVDVVELEPQTIWETDPSGDGRLSEHDVSYFESLRRPVLSHGVGLPVGGTVAQDISGIRLAGCRTAVRRVLERP
jgi:uncharacterized protein